MTGLEKLAGTWMLVRSENVEELLVELGISFILRQLVNCAKCTQELIIRGNVVDLIYDVGFCVNKMTLVIDEEVEINRLNVKHKCFATFDGQKLVVRQTPVSSDVKEQIIHREIIDDQLVMTVYVGNVVCKRIFRRKQEGDSLPITSNSLSCEELMNFLHNPEDDVHV